MLKGIYDETDRYWLDGYSFVDTKTDRCLNFGLKDLARVTVVLNNQEYFLNLQDEQIKDLKNELVKECQEHQEAMQIADKRIKDLEKQLKNAIVPKFKPHQQVFYINNGSIFSKWSYECECQDGIIISRYFLSKDEIVYHKKTKDLVFATEEEARAKLEELKGR